MSIFSYFRRKAPAETRRSDWQLRPNDGQGPYTKYFRQFVPRKVDSAFMEILREAIPIVDAAINRLVSLDGHISVKGDNDKLVDEVKDWFYNIPVNDIQKGVQAFHQNHTSEAFEQGFALGEFVTNKRRNDIVGLRVGDSKYIKFKRSDSGLDILQKDGALGITPSDNRDKEHPDYRLLNQNNLMYFSIHNENQNPYGTPLMRSCEFVSQILVTIQNATKNVWERFGDPSFSIVYKTSKRDGNDHAARTKQITQEFDTAIRAKKQGQSADFIRAIDANSEIEIQVIGHDGQVLEMEVPARHVLEQIVAKTGLPPWMLGLHWSTTERLSNAESEMILSDVATRQSAKMPLFYNLTRTMLRLRGRTWKPGDWWLEWAGVNLHDIVSQAQARFLNAQADMYYLTNASEAGIDIDISDLAIGKKGAKTKKKEIHEHKHTTGCKELHRSFPWPELDDVEKEFTERLQSDWKDLQIKIKGLLGLEMPKGAKAPEDEPVITIPPETRALIMSALSTWVGIYSLDNTDSPINTYYGRSCSLGYLRAAQMSGGGQPLLNILKNREIFEKLKKEGFKLVKNRATKAIVNEILPEMEAYVLAGSNPVEVARRLETLFDKQNGNWERLVNSEMSMAAEETKGEEWGERGIKELDFVPAPDACPLCISLAGTYAIKKCPLPVRDTHPRCRCSRRPAESETI